MGALVVTDDPSAFEWLTLGIALAGLLLGVVNATVQVLTWLRNRARIRVQIGTAIPVGIPGLDPTELYVTLTVRNVRQRPATVTAARFDLPPGREERETLRCSTTRRP
jgi:hypothetical protein